MLLAFDVALRPERVAPVRALYVAPPLIMIVERSFLIRRCEDHGPRHEILLRRSWKFLLCWCPFSNCDVIRRPDELLKLRIGHRSRIHPERIYVHTMHWLRVIRSHWHRMTSFAGYRRAHGKFAARNP